MKSYSHAVPRFSHLEQVGFFLLHLTLDEAQAWQVSRSLDVTESADGRGLAPARESETSVLFTILFDSIASSGIGGKEKKLPSRGGKEVSAQFSFWTN